MDWADWTERLGLTLTPNQRWSFAYLTAHGQRFLVHFGVDNCESLATAHYSLRPVQ